MGSSVWLQRLKSFKPNSEKRKSWDSIKLGNVALQDHGYSQSVPGISLPEQMDTYFSVSTAVSVEGSWDRDIVFSINIIQEVGTRTVLKRYEQLQFLHSLLYNLDVYVSIPELPPVSSQTPKQASHLRSQKQARSIEMYLNRLLLLHPSIFEFREVRGFFDINNQSLEMDFSEDSESPCPYDIPLKTFACNSLFADNSEL